MKITFDIDCTPEEARSFLGLPDVVPMQEALLAELEEQMRENIKAMSPEAMLKTWMPAGIANVEQAQKLFWSQLQQTLTGVAGTTTNALTAFAERARKNSVA